MELNDYIYNTLVNYQKELEVSGYVDDKNLAKMIILDIVNTLTTTDFQPCLSQKDISMLTQLAHRVIGSSCFFSFPKNC